MTWRAVAARPWFLIDGDGAGGNSGYTPLHFASREGQVECVAFLLRSGADVNRATAAGAYTRSLFSST
jgi:hypothetical protein